MDRQVTCPNTRDYQHVKLEQMDTIPPPKAIVVQMCELSPRVRISKRTHIVFLWPQVLLGNLFLYTLFAPKSNISHTLAGSDIVPRNSSGPGA